MVCARQGEVIVPVQQRTVTPIMKLLVSAGQARLAVRPGYRPPMQPGNGSDKLAKALSELRDEETW